MNAVDPIKSLDDIRKMKEFLAKKPRNALLFSFGINSGLRISDILALNVGGGFTRLGLASSSNIQL